METLNHLNEFLGRYEPLWLLLVLFGEFLVSILIWRMARTEFYYDKEFNERKAARRKRQMNYENLTTGEHR